MNNVDQSTDLLWGEKKRQKLLWLMNILSSRGWCDRECSDTGYDVARPVTPALPLITRENILQILWRVLTNNSVLLSLGKNFKQLSPRIFIQTRTFEKLFWTRSQHMIRINTQLDKTGIRIKTLSNMQISEDCCCHLTPTQNILRDEIWFPGLGSRFISIQDLHSLPLIFKYSNVHIKYYLNFVCILLFMLC